MHARREDQIARMLIFGVLLIPVGFFCLLFGIGTKSIVLMCLGPILFAGAVFLIGWAVFYGHFTNRSAGRAGVQWINGCYVVGRYSLDRNHEMAFSDFEENDLPGVKFFVRIKHPDGHDQEYECSRELISQIGEGMMGSVQVKGRWLGSFTPAPRA